MSAKPTALPPANTERLLRTLRELLLIDSPTGDTADMESAMRERLAEFDLSVVTTARGNVLAFHGQRPRRVIAAHLDTLGAMVQSIRPNGRLELTPLGTWSSRFAEGARVTLKTRSGPIRGSILPKISSGHAYNEVVDQQPVTWSQLDLRLDIDSSSREQTEAMDVQIGDVVAVDPQPEFTESGYIVSRFLDNKAAMACTLEMLTLMREHSLTPKEPFLLAYTNAEEIGLGAGTALPANIEELISVDVAPVAENQNSREQAVSLGFKDSLGPHNRVLLERLAELADTHGVHHVRDVFRHYHSDCSSALVAGFDVRTALLGFGTDSTHGYERTHRNSLEGLTTLLLAYCLSPMLDP